MPSLEEFAGNRELEVLGEVSLIVTHLHQGLCDVRSQLGRGGWALSLHPSFSVYRGRGQGQRWV